MWKRVLAAGVLALTLAGCKQGVGDRCQVDSDCQDNLLCFYVGQAMPSVGGQCEPSNFAGFDAAPGDGSGQHDAPPLVDAPNDAVTD